MVRPAASEPLNLPEGPFAARSRAARRLHVRLPYLLYLPLSVTACLTRTRAGSGGAFIGMSPFPAASILLIVTLSGCRDHRIIQPTLALPRPGEPIPSFDLPLRGTWRLASADLHGRPSVLFLWSTHCPTSRRALAEYRRSTTSPERTRRAWCSCCPPMWWLARTAEWRAAPGDQTSRLFDRPSIVSSHHDPPHNEAEE
jgi:hypothetical protein